jgi:tetratricopeptide (TPR) repeat protein
MIRHLSLLLAVFAVGVLTTSTPRAQGELGTIEFPTSGSPAAQPAFLKGVLLLHSFEYEDAKEAFQDAQKADPEFAMAFWGEAMTYNHPVWQQTAPDLAKAALARLAPTPDARLAKAPTPKEKDWLASLETLYGAGDKLARDLAYAEALRRMHEKYPEDDEATAFYALALLGTSHKGRDLSIYMRAAALVEHVYARNPQHPGAAHYLIHSYDDPIHAPLGLRFADAYSKIAPAASHALHMPSHIYFALGMWDEAVAVNERSYQAADARVARKGLGADDRGFHALLWTVYGYLQQGRQQDARGILAQIEADAAKSGSVRTRSHLALARAAWVIEARKWTDAKAPIQATGLGDDAVAADLFAVGFAALRSGNRAAANTALQAMAALAGEAPLNAHAGHTAPPGQPQTGLPAAGAGGDKRVPAVMAQQLEAALLFTEGRREEALVLARQAAVVEDSLSFEFGPPIPVKPAHELVGEMLMDLRRPKEAIPEFEAALKRTPRRALSLLGLGRAATAARDQVTARRAFTELHRMWSHADKTLPELKEISSVVPTPPSSR